MIVISVLLTIVLNLFNR
ncbi:MAG: hypothetical protein HUJ18_08860 [Marinobacter sp.]|nr:hypothetical protein [Marinobacter sp.]